MYEKAVKRGDKLPFEEILSGDGKSPIPSLVDAVEAYPNLHLVRMWRGEGEPTPGATAP